MLYFTWKVCPNLYIQSFISRGGFMSMIVARMQKMKAENLIGIGNHNQRKTRNHSNPDIDTSLSELNYDLVVDLFSFINFSISFL